MSELSGYARKWLRWREQSGQISKATAKEQRYVIAYFVDAMGNRKARQIGEADLLKWRESMADRISPATLRHRWRTAYAFLEWLVDEGAIRRNPARRIPTPKVPRAVHRNLRPDQADAMHDACADDRERLIVALGFQLGMRRGEIARAEIGDIDFVGRYLRITGKGGHQRVVALTDAAETAIKRYIDLHRIHAGPLVRDAEGRHGLTPGYIGEIWQAIAYRAGVKGRPWDGVATHSARHTAGTDVAHRSKDPIVVRDFLGHASLRTTDRYVGQVDLERQREAISGRTYGARVLRS